MQKLKGREMVGMSCLSQDWAEDQDSLSAASFIMRKFFPPK